MAVSSNRKGLSQRPVVTSYAISVAIFLVPFMICAAISERGPLLLFLIPCDIWVLGGNANFVVRLFLLLFLSLGVSGFVVSARQPDRVRWFIFGHVCLLVYYWIWAFSLFCEFVNKAMA